MDVTNWKVKCFIQIFVLIMMFTNGEIATFSSNLITINSSSIETTTIISTDIMTNEYTTIISTEPIPITPDICGVDKSNGINVINRTSTMFIALINYNCSSINASELFIFVNETLVNNCYINEEFSDNITNTTINVRCYSIENNAGRNWTFTIGQINLINKIIVNETLIITLEPLSLDISTNLTIEISDDLTFALILIDNCLDIINPSYLIFRCNSSDLSTNTLSNNCTYTCFYLQPGQIYNVSLVRLSIPIIDKNEERFDEQTLYTIFFTDLDKVTNINFIENFPDDERVLINFDRPRGYYDEIYLYCSAENQRCSNNTKILTNKTENCSDCTSVSIYPITWGVSYKCQGITIKENFPNITSDAFILNTQLKSIINQKSEDIFFFSTSYFMFNVTIQSDFDYIQSYCVINKSETYPCTDLTVVHERCSTILKYNGIRGCNYQCYLVTKKINYIDKYFNHSFVNILPLKPNIIVSDQTSRSISIKWTFNEIVYVQAFQIILNQIIIQTVDKRTSTFNYTNLFPNKNYQLRLKVISNDQILSDLIFVKTLEEAPSIPNNDDIKSKIVPLINDIESKSFEYAIEIDLSLFSNENGFVYSYEIYVRQDQNKNTSKLDSIGTYFDALENPSLDYLSVIIRISRSKTVFSKSNEKVRIILGNETVCNHYSNISIPCNGKLKSDRYYKIVVNGCANPGCTSVLSQPFKTQKNPTKESQSKAWILIFPIFIGLIITGLTIWKRKQIRSFYHRNIKKSGKPAKPSMHFKSDGSISLGHIIRERRPKLLIEYINITREDEKSIYSEYKELEDISPQYRQSNRESKYTIYNRYNNIPARGPWNRTAIRLIGENRLHDYINANQIKSFDNKKVYIACQGPLKETSKDFWDMIIQYNVKTIIMLTKTEEQNPHNPSKPLSKCYQYFPRNIGEVLLFSEIVVKVIDIEYYHNSDLEIRHLNIKQNGNEYNLIHYYFTGWPDYNVIQPNKLIDLIQTINKHRQHSFYLDQTTIQISSIPTVIHCSAGVGRTGTYIAVDTIIRLLDCSNQQLSTIKLDVMAIVYQLRIDRAKMVQTKEQYMLINRCVEQYLKQTRQLDILSKESNIYENVPNNSSISSRNISRNFQESNNVIPKRSRMIDSSSRYVNNEEPRSDTSIHQVNGHKQRSRYDLSNDDHHPYIEHYRSNDDLPPSLPPRRSRNYQSSTKNQQSNI